MSKPPKRLEFGNPEHIKLVNPSRSVLWDEFTTYICKCPFCQYKTEAGDVFTALSKMSTIGKERDHRCDNCNEIVTPN